MNADPVGCVPLLATYPLYLLYTSGTTGKPKGVLRDNGGHLVALTWSMKNIYGVSPGEVYWAASDIGWVVGHSYIVYGPLFHGCTTILYEGKSVVHRMPGHSGESSRSTVFRDFFVLPRHLGHPQGRSGWKVDPDLRSLTVPDVFGG